MTSKGDDLPEAQLHQYRQWFAEARDLSQDARLQSQTDNDYYHGYQLSETEKSVLRTRKQPDGIFNRVRKAVNGSLGVLKQGQVDPRAYPRNPQDEDSANTATKVLQYLKDVNRWDAKRIECAADYLIPGTTAVFVGVDEDGKPSTEQIRWEEFFFDPRSRKADFSDARYMGIAKWMYADDVKLRYPDKAQEIENTIEGGGAVILDETFQDRPNDARGQWYDKRQRRMMVVQIYHRVGQTWMSCEFYGSAILRKGPSQYQDQKGRPTNPIEAQSCYVDRENNRYGIVRDMRAPQDEFNKRRQKLLHMLNNRQVQMMPQGDIALAMTFDADTIRTEAARPDGVLPPGWQPTSQTDLAAGQFNLLGMAEAEMDREGPNPAVLGRLGQNESGRAQLVRQQAGLTEQAIIFGGYEAFELRIYQALWARSRQFMKAPAWVRITDDLKAPEFVGINQPVMGGAVMVQGPDGMATLQPQILGYRNAIAEMDVDIIVDTVPDTANLAAEQFSKLVELRQSGVELPTEILLEASSLPNKRELLEKLQAAKQTDPASQQMQQIAIAGEAAKVDETKSKTIKNLADAHATQAGTQLNEFQAGADMALGPDSRRRA